MTPPRTTKDRIAILGMGKVGTALGFLLKRAGYPVTAIYDISPDAAVQARSFTGGDICLSETDAASRADAVFITTPDDIIADACRRLVNTGAICPGLKVIHVSGAGSLDLLTPAREAGGRVACIHPIQSFADVQGAIASIPGSTFGITADDALRTWAVDLVLDLDGLPFFVPDNDKALYHAAACIASNYLTALLHMVEEIYMSLGLTREEAIRAFWPLVRGTLKNIEDRGTIQALTGPIARGDVGTVEKHLRAFSKNLPNFLDAYSALGMLTTDLGLKKKTLSAEKARRLKSRLQGAENP